MKKALFIDRDGTLILESHDFKIETYEKIVFFPEVFYWLGKIARELDYELILVTNQDGLGTEYFPNEPFYTTHKFIMDVFENEGIHFAKEHIDCTWKHEKKETRKPGTGMLKEYFNGDYDLPNSFVIGDRITDVKLAQNLGCKCFWLNDGRNLGAGDITETKEELKDYTVTEERSWKAIYEHLKALA